MSVPPTRRAGFGQVFRIPEFRALRVVELVSVAGDQLPRVGLGVLVYGRTGSAAWAAVTYALTFLPALVGGPLFGRPADRHLRRTVMIATDAGRAVLVLGMALPGLPPPMLCGLLVAVVLLGPANAAARGALVPEVAPGPEFAAALTVRQVTNQTAQVGGFVVGGVLVARAPADRRPAGHRAGRGRDGGARPRPGAVWLRPGRRRRAGGRMRVVGRGSGHQERWRTSCLLLGRWPGRATDRTNAPPAGGVRVTPGRPPHRATGAPGGGDHRARRAETQLQAVGPPTVGSRSASGSLLPGAARSVCARGRSSR